MKKKILVLLFLIQILFILPDQIFAQTNSSIPLDDQIYKILDQAVIRNLCAPLPGTRPYSRAQVLSAINEILSGENGRLSGAESAILERERKKYSEPELGASLSRGAYFYKGDIFNKALHFTANAGANVEYIFSQSVFSENQDFNWGMDLWVNAYLNGDIGSHFSYDLRPSGGIIYAPRSQTGWYHSYYEGFNDHDNFVDRLMPSYSEPLAYFPYSYQKRWDSSVFFFDKLSADGFQSWPQRVAGVYAIDAEMSASFFENKLNFRFARLAREWGAGDSGSSLILNSSARPFLAFEMQIQPFPWFVFSSLTGELEYYNQFGIITSSQSFQNAYSITEIELKPFKFLQIDFGEAVVWPKRWELGYIDPLISDFFYQNNIGDFDNLMIFLNLKSNIAGVLKLWFSFYDDESNIEEGMEYLDRTMLAFQGGFVLALPFLPFSSVKLTYTKIEPYTYTHTRIYVPWYNENNGPMEIAYVNNGVSLGYYLPPNADELLLRFEAMPAVSTSVHFQYQMIRHGADFGPNAPDGSSYQSELDPSGRDDKSVLRKYFLQDGAYQWQHILKVGCDHTFSKFPLKVFAEAGVVFSYFTNIDGQANAGSASDYHIVDEAPYTKSTNLILTLGIKFFPD